MLENVPFRVVRIKLISEKAGNKMQYSAGKKKKKYTYINPEFSTQRGLWL